ncbi:MAG: urease accessory protein UreD [Chloroflexota bacterium]
MNQPNQATRLEGKLGLTFEAQQNRTVLHVREQTPPLKVIRAFDVNGMALVHLHNVSGGVLSGDLLKLDVMAEAGSRVQLTTTSATRLYRSRPDFQAAQQITTLHVGANALLEYVPDPLIPFAGTRYEQHTTIDLAEGAGLFWWEVVAPGRTARGELFNYESLKFKTQITAHHDRLMALEQSHLCPQTRPLSSLTHLGSYRYFATFYVCKVGLEPSRWLALEAELNDLALQLTRRNEVVWGVSTLTAHGVVIRALAYNGRDITAGLLDFWRMAKLALYGQTPILPRKVY